MNITKTVLQVFLFVLTAFYSSISLARGIEPITENNLANICTGYEKLLSIYGADANTEYTPNISPVSSSPRLPVWGINNMPPGIFFPAINYDHFAILRSSTDSYPLISLTDKSRYVAVIMDIYQPSKGNWDELRSMKAFSDRRYDFSFSGLVETGLHHTPKDVNCFATDQASQIYLAIALISKALAMGPHGKVIAVLQPAGAKGWIIVSVRDSETISHISLVGFSDLNKVIRSYITTPVSDKFSGIGFAIAEKHIEVLNDPPSWLKLVGAVAAGGSLADSEKLRHELLKAGFDQGSISSLDRYIAEQKQGLFVHSAQFQY